MKNPFFFFSVGEANGRVAGHFGVCSGCKEIEDCVQMIWREMERSLNLVVYANRYWYLKCPLPSAMMSVTYLSVACLCLSFSVTRLVLLYRGSYFLVV